MAIDKSLSQYYDVPGTKKIKGQLHKLAYITPKEAKALKKMGGKEVITDSGIPAYPPQGRAEQHGGRSSSSSGRNGGGGGPPGGGDRQMTYSAPAPARSPHRDPDPVPINVITTAKAPPSILSRETKPKIDTGPKRDMHDFEIKKRKTIDITGGNPFLEDPYEKKIVYEPSDLPKRAYDPRTDPNALLKRPSGILGTLGKVALTGLTAGAGAGLFGKDIATIAKLANYKKRYDSLQKSALGKKLGLKKFDVSNLTSTIDKAANLRSRPKDMPEHLGERGFKIRDDTTTGGEGEGPKTIAEQVTQGAGLEEGQKMLGLDDKQIQQIYQGRNLLNKTIETGVYQGKRLTADQIKLLQNKRMELNNLIDAIETAQAPVGAAYGGRIDKALGGRSRDIG